MLNVTGAPTVTVPLSPLERETVPLPPPEPRVIDIAVIVPDETKVTDPALTFGIPTAAPLNPLPIAEIGLPSTVV